MEENLTDDGFDCPVGVCWGLWGEELLSSQGVVEEGVAPALVGPN